MSETFSGFGPTSKVVADVNIDKNGRFQTMLASDEQPRAVMVITKNRRSKAAPRLGAGMVWQGCLARRVICELLDVM